MKRLLAYLFMVLGLTILFQSKSFASIIITHDVDAEKAILIDFTSGKTLLEKNADQPIAPGSMTKIMTSVIAFDYLKKNKIKLSDKFFISEKAWRMSQSGYSAMFIMLNDKISVENLLKGIIIVNGNDASVALAEGIAGSEAKFVTLMNKKAKEIGLKKTNFANSTGILDANNYSTVRDIAKLSAYLIKNYPKYYHYYKETKFTWNRTGGDAITQGNRNPLLYKNIGVDGLKTSFTKKEGYALTSSVKFEDKRLIAVGIGFKSKKDRFKESIKLFSWGIRNYAKFNIPKKEPTQTQQVAKKENEKVALIIGIEKYSNIPKASFARSDAKYFFEYARQAFGVKKSNIKLLLDKDATLVKTQAAINLWLPSKIRKNNTELIIFFAGHGLSSNDGRELYLLIHDTNPNILNKSAISISQLFKEIIKLKPKSVTMFMDTSFSGASRDNKVLLANANPIRIIAEQPDAPKDFTIFFSSKLDQISSVLKEAKHGIFSYYLMKGLEGYADINSDKRITNGELLAYIDQNASKTAFELGREQNATLVGDSNKILISYKNKKIAIISNKKIKIAKEEPKKKKKKVAKVVEQEQKEFKPKKKDLDNDPPIIEIAEAITVDSQAYTLKGKVKDKSKQIYLTIDGRPVEVKRGKFTLDRFNFDPEIVEEIKIVAIDKWNNRSEKIVKVTVKLKATEVVRAYEELKPNRVKVKTDKNKIAIIIGIEKYENLINLDAKYANRDAKAFRAYATQALGVKSSNIKILVDDKANRGNTLKAFKLWLPKIANNDGKDIYVFFAGHGLASENGEDLYILPQDGDAKLLDDTAITRVELISLIQKVNPKSVTMFFDTCYSGQTRDEKMLVASLLRPITIVAEEQDTPDNFTIFSASNFDQASGGIEEAKHGMFSYYLMKGLEGKADGNKDKQITNGELIAYLKTNVSKEAFTQNRNQDPMLTGNPDQVLMKY